MAATTVSQALAERKGKDPAAGPPGVLAVREDQDWWDEKQLAALRQLGITDATNADLAVFMHYVQRTGLDPFSRQIYMIGRRERRGNDWVIKQTIQVGIDGFRVIARRAATKAGITIEYEDTQWADADGNWVPVWIRPEPPMAAKVVVLRDGMRFPGICRFSSYAAYSRDGDLVSQWKTQPDHMIEKCAEAYALRRAFPLDLAGIYAEEEMPEVPEELRQRPKRASATIVPPSQPASETAPADDSAGFRTVVATHYRRLGVTDEKTMLEHSALLVDRHLASSADLEDDEVEHLLTELEGCESPEDLARLLAEQEAALQ